MTQFAGYIESTYDQHNIFVYWLINPIGFYHSWDNNTFVKRD